MKYKVDKYPAVFDEETSRYTTRRIRELRGEKVWEDGMGPLRMHPYIRRRLDEIKQQQEEGEG